MTTAGSSKPYSRYIFNCLPSRGTEMDWPVMAASEAGILAAAAVPSEFDLRENWWRVGSQGETGSCVGWAVADSMLRWHFVKTGKIKKSEKLSVRFIWMAAKETDQFISRPTTFIEKDGTSLKAALDIARKFGSVKDAALSFKSGRLYPQDASVFYALASTLRIANYFNLGLDINVWKKWISSQGPILTRLDIDSTWMNASKTEGRLLQYRPETCLGGHAVSIVGYTPDYFIIRNSWGEGWGAGGFGYATPAYATQAFTEAYGVSI